MADCIPGEITIGGTIPDDVLGAFLGEVNSTGASVGGYGGTEAAFKTTADLTEALDDDGHLLLVDDQASFGQFEGLEDFCVKHGISFDRHSDAKYEFDAENVSYRTGMKKPVSIPSNNDGEDLFSVKAVRPVVKELTKVVTAGLNRDKLKAAAVKIIRHLNSLLPPEVESLPPLQVGD